MTAPEPKFAAAAGRLSGTTWCIHVAGEIDTASAPRLRGHLAAVARRTDVDLVIVDLADVSFIDAAAIGTLIQGKQDLQQTGKALRLTGARGGVAELLLLTDLIDELGAELTDLPTVHDRGHLWQQPAVRRPDSAAARLR